MIELCSLLLLVGLPIVSVPADGWSNGGYSADPANPDYGTHDWIAQAALDLQSLDVTFLETLYHTEFLLGTEAPDNPSYIGDTANHHVYYFASGSVQDDICADRASQIYSSALGYLRSGDNHSAAFEIGVLAHYVSDPGVFGHTMGAYTDWGAEVHHSDYEDRFEAILGSLSQPSGISLGDSDAYNATMGLAQKITFGSGGIKSNTWMDDNYNWADPTFESSAIASLSESVSAVASVINHLMSEKTSSSPPTTQPQVPGRPIGLTAVVEHSHVRLSWSGPASDGGSPITGYMILRKTGNENPAEVATVPSDTFSWLDESVVKGKTYSYWIAAQNSVGSSAMSVEATIIIPKESNSILLPLIVAAVAAALASGGGVLLWRRRAKGKS